MMQIDSEAVVDALSDSLCRLMKPTVDQALSLEDNPNLLDHIDGFEFGELIADLGASLDVELPLDQIDYTSIAHIDRLIDFICKHGR